MFVWSTLDAWRYGKLDLKSKSKSLIKHKRISIRFNWKTNHNVKEVEVLGMVSNNCVHYGYSYLWMVLWIRLSLILHLLLLSLAAYVINEKTYDSCSRLDIALFHAWDLGSSPSSLIEDHYIGDVNNPWSNPTCHLICTNMYTWWLHMMYKKIVEVIQIDSFPKSEFDWAYGSWQDLSVHGNEWVWIHHFLMTLLTMFVFKIKLWSHVILALFNELYGILKTAIKKLKNIKNKTTLNDLESFL